MDSTETQETRPPDSAIPGREVDLPSHHRQLRTRLLYEVSVFRLWATQILASGSFPQRFWGHGPGFLRSENFLSDSQDPPPTYQIDWLSQACHLVTTVPKENSGGSENPHGFRTCKITFRLFLYFTFVCSGSSLLCSLFSGWSEWGLLSSCSAWASHCSSFSCGL